MKIIKKYTILAIFLTISVLFSTHTFAENFTFGVLPHNSARQIIKLYGPVALEFEKTIESKVQLKTSRSFTKFASNLEREIYDFALIQPFNYTDAIEKYNYVPLARVNSTLSAYFVVRNNSEIKSLNDLKNKIVALPPRPAAVSHLAKIELRDAGMTLGKDVKIKHHRNHDSCLHEVLAQRADACATGPLNIKILKADKKTKFRVLKQSKILPNILLIAHKRVPQATIEKLRNKIINWKTTQEGKQILKTMGSPGFVKVKDDDYAIMYTLYKPELSQSKKTQANNIVLGIIPYIPAKRLAKRMAPVRAAFQKIMGDKSVIFRTASSYNQYNKNIGQGIYDIVLMQPFDYKTAIKQGYKPIAQISYDIQATIYINKDSGITSFDDLKGKVVASAPWHAATSRLFNQKIRQSNLWTGKDIFMEYKTTHFECFKQLKKRKAAACISGPLVLASLPDELSNNVTLLEKTHSVPGILFMVHSRMGKKIQKKIKSTILNWHKNPEGKEILKHSRLKHFVEVDVERYESIQPH